MFPSPFPKWVGFAAVAASQFSPEQLESSILAQELALLSPQANAKRRADFLLGRIAAHRALAAVDNFLVNQAVLKGKRDEPLWPKEIIGSITHSGSWAAAAVARTQQAKALGIDLQQIGRRVPFDIGKFICGSEELQWVNESAAERGERLLSLFSAKESIYKALFPICQRYFGFHDVVMVWQKDLKTFQGTLQLQLCAELPQGFSFEVHCEAIEPDFVFTWLLL